jgi:hypothetical protein
VEGAIIGGSLSFRSTDPRDLGGKEGGGPGEGVGGGVGTFEKKSGEGMIEDELHERMQDELQRGLLQGDLSLAYALGWESAESTHELPYRRVGQGVRSGGGGTEKGHPNNVSSYASEKGRRPRSWMVREGRDWWERGREKGGGMGEGPLFLPTCALSRGRRYA